MKLVIVTTDSFYSCLMISALVQRHSAEVAAIVITPSRLKGKGLFGTISHVVKKSGVRSLVHRVVTGLAVNFVACLNRIGLVGHCVTPSMLARRHGIELRFSENCNDQPTLDFLRAKAPDLLLSINVYQRMLAPLLELPTICAVNIHFGLLPKYRGMAPYVWAMANGEKEIGLSVHRMVLAFDEGRLIRQLTMPLRANDSVTMVYLRACVIARELLVEAVNELRADPEAGFPQSGDGSYFSMPDRSCLSRLRANGYSLWRISDLWAFVRPQSFCIDLT